MQMNKVAVMTIVLFIMGMMTGVASGASIGYIDGQKVFSSYDKTKKAQEQFKKKEQVIQDEITKKQKQIEQEKTKGTSDADLRKLVEKFEKELAPKQKDLIESQNKVRKEIQGDIVKATEVIAKKMGIEIVLDKQIFVTGGTDLTAKVIEQLNKK
ncbi:MAG TPA: OmpH family outer membrane protein [Smithella sp.]|nr:OmpH family outer membrane protein [Smithella sp.]